MASHRARDALALLTLLSGSAAGQANLAVDLGVAELRQPGRIATTATVFAGDLRITRERASFGLSATGAAADGASTGQALLVASLFTAPSRRVRGELSGIASTSAATGQWPVTSVQAMARASMARGTGGVLAGAAAGRSGWGGEWLPVVSGEVGAWQRRADDVFSASATLTDTRSEFRVATDYGYYRETYPITYADAALSWARDLARGSVGATAGFRAGFRETPARAGWGSLTASWWTTPHLALVGSIGRSPEDVVRGLPESRYAQLGLRWNGRPQFTRRVRPANVRGPRLAIERGTDGHRMTLSVAGAGTVEIMSDFTEWAPVALAATADGWVLTRSLTPGPHRLAIRIDGGPWIVPTNLPRAASEFGIAVGLITVL